MKNKPSFYGKQAVVLRKVTRRFMKSDPSFYRKRAVLLWEMSRCFRRASTRV